MLRLFDKPDDILKNKIICEDSCIINLIEDDWRFNLYARRLQLRRLTIHPGKKCTVIPADRLYNMDNINQLGSDGPRLQLYIIAHSDSGSDHITTTNWSNKQFQIRYDDLAQRLHEFIGDRDVVINLIACSAARGAKILKDPDNMDISHSFAAQFHKELLFIRKKNQKNDIPVIARTENIIINPIIIGGAKLTSPGTHALFGRHKKPGSKVIFAADKDDNQIAAQAYPKDKKLR